MPRLRCGARVGGDRGRLFFTGIYVLARAGFAAGISVLLVSICVLGVVYLGRRLGFVLIGLSALAHLAVGLLVTHGIIRPRRRGVDPDAMQNWFRMAAITSLLRRCSRL